MHTIFTAAHSNFSSQLHVITGPRSEWAALLVPAIQLRTARANIIMIVVVHSIATTQSLEDAGKETSTSWQITAEQHTMLGQAGRAQDDDDGRWRKG